jgi:hypothetical protein
LTKLSTIHNIAILGGVGAIISPFVSLYISLVTFRIQYFSPFYFMYGVGSVLFLLLFLTGLISLILTIHTARFVSTMPQRAAGDLKTVGIVVVVVGIFSVFNLFTIISGLLILAAGVECGTIWEQIRQARTQTGWPLGTVATAVGSTWARRISCRFCGAPLVIMAASSFGHSVRVETQCPLDETHDTLQLPLSQLDAWAPVAADRLHRCVKCGIRTVAQIIVRQTPLVSQLQAYCPNGHPNRIYRKIWTPLYPHLARIPSTDVGFQESPSPLRYRPATFTPQTETLRQPITISARNTESIRAGPIGYCTQCGVKVESSDRYCFRCGATIR